MGWRLMGAPPLIGSSASMELIRVRLRKVATTPLPVMICGETGTGKEVVARQIHHLSGRTGAFVPVDCGALSHQLVESELFGYEKGAFTGANQRRDGLVYAAVDGTFFLDEVGELPLAAQTRLLRLLEEGRYRPVGAAEERSAEIRIVAATWRDLRKAVESGAFRQDLYHRLAVVEFHLSPLRNRPEDVEDLLEYFLAQTDRAKPVIDAATMSFLRGWPWPGNTRELRNVAKYLCAMHPGQPVGMTELPPQLRRTPHLANPAVRGDLGSMPRVDLPYMEARRAWLEEFQVRYVSELLKAHDGNISAAARAADMDRRSIQRILSRERDPGASTP